MAVPDQITDLAATSGVFSSSVLTWTAPADNGFSITDYFVEFSTDNITFTEFEHDTSTAVTITVTGLENNQTNYFRVSAISSEGTATASDVATAIPEEVPIAEYCTVKNIAD